MTNDLSVKESNSTQNIHRELKELASSLMQIVNSIKTAQQPLAESKEKVPEATEQLEKITKQTESATHKVLDVVEAITAREGEIETYLKDLRRVLPTTYFRNNSRVKRIMEKISKTVCANQDDAFQIMDALQFQDITNQQMDHAISMLEAVELRIEQAIENFQGRSSPDNNKVTKQRAFDPNARFSTNSSGQSEVDELLNGILEEKKQG